MSCENTRTSPSSPTLDSVEQLRRFLSWYLSDIQESKEALETIINQDAPERLWFYHDISNIYQSSKHIAAESQSYFNSVADGKIIEEHLNEELAILKQINNVCADIKNLHDHYYFTYIQVKHLPSPGLTTKKRFSIKDFIVFLGLVISFFIFLPFLIIKAVFRLFLSGLEKLAKIARFVYKKLTGHKQSIDLSIVFGKQVPLPACIKIPPYLGEPDRTAEDQLEQDTDEPEQQLSAIASLLKPSPNA